jgi:hypothetical protein
MLKDEAKGGRGIELMPTCRPAPSRAKVRKKIQAGEMSKPATDAQTRATDHRRPVLEAQCQRQFGLHSLERQHCRAGQRPLYRSGSRRIQVHAD